MNSEHKDSAAFLKEELSRRVRSNPRYSLRAFARDAGLAPGSVSLLLTRKKRLSVNRAHEIARRLSFDSTQMEHFLLLVELEAATSLARKSDLQTRLRERLGHSIFDLSIDQFKLISDWYGLALLVLFTEVTPPPGRREAARSLQITLAEVDATLERLQRLELIERAGGTDEHPRFRRSPETVMVKSAVPHEAIQCFYRGVLKLCEASTDAQAPAERVTGAQIFAFDPSQTEEVRRLTDDYLKSLNQLAEKGQRRSELYLAYANVFRVTQKKGKELK